MRHFVAALLAFGVVGLGRLEGRDEQLPGWFDLPVHGGASVLDALDISRDERAFALPILARALHDRESRVGLSPTELAAILSTHGAPSVRGSTGREVIAIPAPLDAPTWRELLPPAKTDDLFAQLLTDRDALFVAVALMSGDDSLRSLAARDRDLLRFVYRGAAGPLLVTARRLHIADGRVVVPGGPGAEAIWQSLVGESPARAAPFIRALLAKDDGRLAWYYDTIGGLAAERLAVVWPEGPVKFEAATSLYESFRATDPQWRVPEQPLRRGVIDAWTVVTQPVIANGALQGRWGRSFWEMLFFAERIDREDATRVLRASPQPVTVGWLARETLTAAPRERRHRFEMFCLAQRVFGRIEPLHLPDVAVALSGLRHHRSLLLALERMQLSDPRTWAVVVEAARHVSTDADNQRDATAAFQGVIALLERMRHVRTLDVPTTERLLRSLADTVRTDNRVTRSLARWISGTWAAALPPLVRPDAWTGRTAYESRILQAMAGPVDRPPRSLDWEGLSYAVDIVAAEHGRLRAMRTLLPSPGLDAALLNGRPHDLAGALTTLVYATALGDPEGPASLSPDIVTRHDLGFDSTSVIGETATWAPPEERQGSGPWRVQGSLIGLDLGLSRLALRRLTDQQMPSPPALTLNDLGTLTRTAAVMSAGDFIDADRDQLVAAIERGRKRVAAAASAKDIAALGREVGMSSTTRELLPWIVSRQRETVADVFSLRDLMWLGQPAMSATEIDRWGVAGDAIDGRRTTVMPRPAAWDDYAGRSEAGQITTQVPDLALRLAEETARRRVPAVLVPALLGFALQDYWHEVRARFADDWYRLTRQAAALSASRFEDYVAALAGNGPLRAQ